MLDRPQTVLTPKEQKLIEYVEACSLPSNVIALELAAIIHRLDARVGDANRLADEVAVLIRLGKLDARSPAGDALLDFREPPTTSRADRMAALTRERDALARVLENLVRIADSVAETENIGGLDEAISKAQAALAQAREVYPR